MNPHALSRLPYKSLLAVVRRFPRVVETARTKGGRVGYLVVQLCLCATGLMLTVAASAQVPNAERGQALYENHCVVCHTGKVHARVNRIAVSRAEVTEIVNGWQLQQKLGWGSQEVADVVEFLNRTRYHFN